MSFEEIIGQRRAIEDLQAAYLRGRIPNAYLFAGPLGVGKASTAMILARLLNCQGVRADTQPCDVCPSCRKITHGNHTDVWTLEPEKSTFKIKQIREMQRLVRFPPTDGKMRVVILDAVETMNQESANAFLKTLEEPPPNNLFILITSSPSKLLPTILSRCQRVPFAPLPRAGLQNLLVERHGFDPVAADLAAGIAEGSVGKALQLDELLAGEERRTFLQALPALHTRPNGVAVAMDLAEKLSKAPASVPTFLMLLRVWYRDLLFLREVPDPEDRLINRDLMSVLVDHAAQISTPAIAAMIRNTEEAEVALKRNVSAQLALEHLLLSAGPSF